MLPHASACTLPFNDPFCELCTDLTGLNTLRWLDRVKFVTGEIPRVSSAAPLDPSAVSRPPIAKLLAKEFVAG